MMDPDTKSALVGTLGDFGTDVYTPDYYGATVLFLEPDVTHRTVTEAWLCTNVFPKGNGEILGKKEKTAAGETLSLGIEFASITMNNESVRKLAQSFLDKLSIVKSDPSVAPAFVTEEDANLKVNAAPIGFDEV